MRGRVARGTRAIHCRGACRTFVVSVVVAMVVVMVGVVTRTAAPLSSADDGKSRATINREREVHLACARRGIGAVNHMYYEYG